MSRTNTARETVSLVMRGTESELSIKESDETRATVFFRRAYWRDEDHLAITVALIDKGFDIVDWTIHGGAEGLVVELRLVDTTIPVCKHPEVREIAGCEDCPDWPRCEHEKVRY